MAHFAKHCIIECDISTTDYQSTSMYSCDCAGAMAVSAEVIKQTQASLGQFVKKPPLTDKLLNKPPFR